MEDRRRVGLRLGLFICEFLIMIGKCKLFTDVFLSFFSPKQGEPADEVRLRGEKTLVNKLKTELEKAAAALRDRVVMGVVVPAPQHKTMIGRGGQHLNVSLICVTRKTMLNFFTGASSSYRCPGSIPRFTLLQPGW